MDSSLIAELHEHERKLLLMLLKHSSVDDMVKAGELKEAQILRAMQWLLDKKLVQVTKQLTETVELDKNGELYRKKGLPEKRFLSAVSKGKIELAQLMQQENLSREEANASIGLLKRLGLINIKKGKELVFEITDKGKQSPGFIAQAVLQECPLKLGKLTDKHKQIVQDLLKRKSILKITVKRIVSASLTDKGKKIAANAELKQTVVDRLTPKMIKDGSWKQARLRSYNLKAPVPRLFLGKKQPYRRFLEEVRAKFVGLGFEEMTGPIVESEFWNMDALFMPQFHSAREIHDVYYIKEPKYANDLPKQLVKRVKEAHEKGILGSKGWRYEFSTEKTSRLILRSQTTACSSRKLASEDLKVPGKYFAVGRCFRYDVIDAKHLSDFNQIEGIVVEQGLNLRHLIGLLKLFAEEFCGTDEVRVVPSYFPFTEPSAALYAKHPKLGWIELGGAGIFRPEMVMPLVGKHLTVLAWGIGIDRLAMFKLGLNDIRELFSHDLEYLRTAKVV